MRRSIGLFGMSMLLLSAVLLGSCGSSSTTLPETDTETTEQDTDKPAESETEEPVTPGYVYPEGEYDAFLPLFGNRSDFFAQGERSGDYIPEIDLASDGRYIQTRGAMEISSPRTFASVDRPYSQAMHVNTDAYVVNYEYAGDYRAAGYSIIGHSGSFNKNENFLVKTDLVQARADGSRDGLWDSLVLVKSLIDSNSRRYLAPDIKTGNWFIGFAEPEMFREGLYCKAFRNLWEEKYVEDFEDPHTEPRTAFMGARLSVWTHTNAIKMYRSYLNSKDPDFENFYIAPHSTLAYRKLGVFDGYVHMMGTGLVKTVTGQTWSNTMENAFRYEGHSVTDPFINGLLDYGTYLDAADYYGADLYALCDPMSDTSNGRNEAYWRQLCHHQLVASLMYPEINHWELIWTNRSFVNVSQSYRSEQLNIHNALLEISGAPYELTAGTPGITYLLGDSLTWQDTNKEWGLDPYDGFWGVSAPLLYDGILMRTKAMELITKPEDLKDVSVLIVSYDNQKPLYEELNAAIADWVKAGGSLLVLGGPDAYIGIPEAYWNEEGKGGSPVGNLLMHMGLNGITPKTLNEKSELNYSRDGQTFDASSMKTEHGPFTYCFEGTGFDSILTTASGKTVGLETPVGRGNLILVGLPTHDFGDSVTGGDLLRTLVEAALEYTDYEYRASDDFIVRRGNYTAVYALKDSVRLTGRYVNIFSDDLEILTDPVIAKGESALLRRIDGAGDAPEVCYAGGFLVEGSLKQTAAETSFEIYAAENALIPIRIQAPAELYPTSVRVTYGDTTVRAASAWDDASHSLLVSVYSTPTSHAAVRVEWGEAKDRVQDSAYTLAAEYTVNASGTDAPFIVKSTGKSTATNRYCDKDWEIVWKFDVSAYENLQLAVSLVNNYILEVSEDGEHWIEVANYSLVSSTRASGTNQTVITVSTASLGIGSDLYVRLRNTDPNQGWGGAVSKFEFYELRDREP